MLLLLSFGGFLVSYPVVLLVPFILFSISGYAVDASNHEGTAGRLSVTMVLFGLAGVSLITFFVFLTLYLMQQGG